MPSKKKKYNARFPPARIKKIMQTDEEIGKVAAAVPVIISRALELFLESLLTKACQVTQSRNAKTMTSSHLGRKPGSGRKNGGAGMKGKDKKQSGTESEQEDDSEDSETEGEEEEEEEEMVSQPSSTNPHPAARFQSSAAPPYLQMGSMQAVLGVPVTTPPAPPPAPPPRHHEGSDDEDYDS
ncbi:dr1-associated corepressor isoform X3 [Polyodon spathula]|uniref:dr1-associated corepressor isoform X3 n=1 Tax=Polyodon spathula TaxID=7913 RepID=UPI001B7E8B42|nr:dr1-associated corepressor isoform X3 [Polyodon spathula]